MLFLSDKQQHRSTERCGLGRTDLHEERLQLLLVVTLLDLLETHDLHTEQNVSK